MRITAHTLKHVVMCDSCSRNAAGNFLFRRTFFYKIGGSAESFRDSVVNQLQAAEQSKNVKFTVVDCGEVTKPFRGGASVRQTSHWWVEIMFD